MIFYTSKADAVFTLKKKLITSRSETELIVIILETADLFHLERYGIIDLGYWKNGFNAIFLKLMIWCEISYGVNI